jgi:hypothetical protein
MERRITLTGQLNPCKCGRQPQVIYNFSKNRHRMECPPCGIRLWEFTSLTECVTHWEELPLWNPATPDAVPVSRTGS